MDCFADIASLRSEFEILSSRVYGVPLVYFDNAATSQRPRSVVEMERRMMVEANANIHRAVHRLSAVATDLYEAGREAARIFIGADSREEVIFTSGTTAGINLVAAGFARSFLSKGDKVVVSRVEHHSNIVPWQIACNNTGAELVVAEVDECGRLSAETVDASLDENVKLLAVTQVSNVLGVINPIKEIVAKAHAKGIPVLVDGAQGIVHCATDVKELDADFYVFSGHKIFAPTGIGILYGKTEWLDSLPVFMSGGDMVDRVSFEKTTFAPLPLRFEAGTQNFAAAACMVPALEMAAAVRTSAAAMANEKMLMEAMEDCLRKVDGLRMPSLGVPAEERIPVFSFTVEGTHPSDLAQIMDKMGVALRSGLMCAEPLISQFSDKGMLRASLMPYNTLEEVEIFAKALDRAVKMLR